MLILIINCMGLLSIYLKPQPTIYSYLIEIFSSENYLLHIIHRLTVENFM